MILEKAMLATDQLRANDYNPNRMTQDEFAELVEEVRHLGRLPKPVVVRSPASFAGAGEGYEIVDGEHGWRAAREVGLAEVACEVIEADDFEAMRQTYKRNQHGTHDRVALGRMFRRISEERGLSNRDLAKEINVSEGTVRNALTILEAAELRNGYARKPQEDYRFDRMGIRQARVYVALPAAVRDRWLEAGGDEGALTPEGWRFEGLHEAFDWYARCADAGFCEVFERGAFSAGVQTLAEVWLW